MRKRPAPKKRRHKVRESLRRGSVSKAGAPKRQAQADTTANALRPANTAMRFNRPTGAVGRVLPRWAITLAARPSEPPYDPFAAAVNAMLKAMSVQRVEGYEGLCREQAARLARLARAKIPNGVWGHLTRCDGGPCPNPICSAGCAFGERAEVNRVVLEASELFRTSGMMLFTASLIDPHYFQPLGSLSKMSIGGLLLSLRRRIKAATVMAGGLAVGSIHVSLDREADGRMYWTPHVHLVVAVASNLSAERVKMKLEFALAPKRDAKGIVRKPKVVKVVTNLANAISYATKVNVDTRDAAEDRRGNRTRHRFHMPPAAVIEHDLWLLGLKPRQRLFLSGMMHSRGGVVLRSRGQ